MNPNPDVCTTYTLHLPVLDALSEATTLDWLLNYGQQLEPPLPNHLPPLPGKVYVRWAKPYPTQIHPSAFIELGLPNHPVTPHLSAHSTINWVWFSVPKLLVLPYTDAPLF